MHESVDYADDGNELEWFGKNVRRQLARAMTERILTRAKPKKTTALVDGLGPKGCAMACSTPSEWASSNVSVQLESCGGK